MEHSANAIPSHFRSLFRVLEKGEKTKKGIRLVLDTAHGPRGLWCPRRSIRLYKYREKGETIQEALIPDWLAEQAGLI